MFEASVDGQPYDTERWGQYFRPAGVNAPGGAAAPADVDEDVAKPALRVAAPSKAAPADSFDDEPAAASAPVAKPAGDSKTQDILAMIRARQQK